MNTSKKSLVLFGDSLFGRFSKGYIDKLEAAAPGYAVYNCATGGFNTDDCVERVGFISKLKPDVVALSIGGNDAAPWKVQVPKDRFIENLNTTIEAFEGSRIIVFPCPPAHDPADLKGTDGFNAATQKYNEMLKKVCDENGVDIINSEHLYQELLENNTTYHLEDGIHLNEVGYDVFIKSLAQLLTT